MDLKSYYENALFLEDGFQDMIQSSEDFYDLTLQRDQAFIDNMLEKMEHQSASAPGTSQNKDLGLTGAPVTGALVRGVLITGGYHTPNLKKLLKERNISYIVLTPTITHETNTKRYEQLLLNQTLTTPIPNPVLSSQPASYTMMLTRNPENMITLLPKPLQDLARRDVAAARLAVTETVNKEYVSYLKRVSTTVGLHPRFFHVIDSELNPSTVREIILSVDRKGRKDYVFPILLRTAQEGDDVLRSWAFRELASLGLADASDATVNALLRLKGDVERFTYFHSSANGSEILKERYSLMDELGGHTGLWGISETVSLEEEVHIADMQPSPRVQEIAGDSEQSWDSVSRAVFFLGRQIEFVKDQTALYAQGARLASNPQGAVANDEPVYFSQPQPAPDSDQSIWVNPDSKRIAVIGGAGYVGATKAITSVTDFGHDVTAVDIDSAKVELLKDGKLPHYAPGMDELLVEAQNTKRLRFVHQPIEDLARSQLAAAIYGRRYIYLAVPTPSGEDGEANTQYLEQAVRDIAKIVKQSGEPKILIGKSTAPPKTIDTLKQIVQEELGNQKKDKISFAWEPEFLREGKELEDERGGAGRVVIGAEDPAVAEEIKSLYQSVNPIHPRTQMPFVLTDIKSAMLIKYAANGFRGMKISFINFIGWLAEQMGFDIVKIADLIGADPRINRGFLNAGLGFGGSCFPKDFLAFLQMAKRAGVEAGILLDSLVINDLQWRRFVKNIVDKLGPNADGKTVAILGAAFKPGTSDVREARSIKIIQELLKEGIKVRVFDPEAIEELKKQFPKDKNIDYFSNPSDMTKMLEGVSGIALVTEWEDFRGLDFGKIRGLFSGSLPFVFDGRNFLPKDKLKSLGFDYSGIGLGNPNEELTNGRLKEFNEFVETVKVFFLALRISFVNLTAQVADKEGANIRDVLWGLGLDPVVGKDYLVPGIGFGGNDLFTALDKVRDWSSKLLRDTRQPYYELYDALQKKLSWNPEKRRAEDHVPFVTPIKTINDAQIKLYIEKLEKSFGLNLEGKKVAVLGLTFKPGSYSIKNSPPISLVRELLKRGALVRLMDEKSQAIENAKRELDASQEKIAYFESASEAVRGSDAQILATDSEIFKDWKSFFFEDGKSVAAQNNLVDGRHFYSLDQIKEMRSAGIRYLAVGIPDGARLALSESDEQILNQVAGIFALDDSDRQYLTELWIQFKDRAASSNGSKQLKMILDIDNPKEDENFIVTALLSDEEKAKWRPVIRYSDLEGDPLNAEAAKEVTVIASSMDGGIGESVKREKELKRRARELGKTQTEIDKIVLGAKGTDLGYYLRDYNNEFVSIAEVKFLRLLHLAGQRLFGKIKLQLLVNYQSINSYKKLLDKTYFSDRHDPIGAKKRSYRQMFEENGIEILPMVEQKDIPYASLNGKTLVMDKNSKLKQPGGHAQLGFRFLDNLVRSAKSGSSDKPVVRVFYNGDNVNSSIDESIMGAVVRNRWPVVKLTVTAERIDKKGGKEGVRVIQKNDRKLYIPDQMEEADAKAVGQVKDFHSAGQPKGIGREQTQDFNTNIFYINETLLAPILKDLRDVIGDEVFYSVIAPSLIFKAGDKSKIKTDESGNSYAPLDGAIGTVMHNLNRYFEENRDRPEIQAIFAKHGVEKILHFVDVPRDKFFTPFKNPFDLYLQRSDFYSLDVMEWLLKRSPDSLSLPEVELENFFSETDDLTQALGADTDVTKLTGLFINGPVKLADPRSDIKTVLAGEVKIKSSFSGEINLLDEKYRSQIPSLFSDHTLKLKNVSIEIDSKGNVVSAARLAAVAGNVPLEIKSLKDRTIAAEILLSAVKKIQESDSSPWKEIFAYVPYEGYGFIRFGENYIHYGTNEQSKPVLVDELRFVKGLTPDKRRVVVALESKDSQTVFYQVGKEGYFEVVSSKGSRLSETSANAVNNQVIESSFSPKTPKVFDETVRLMRDRAEKYDKEMYEIISKNPLISGSIKNVDIIIGIPVYQEHLAAMKQLLKDIKLAFSSDENLKQRSVKVVILLGAEPSAQNTLSSIPTTYHGDNDLVQVQKLFKPRGVVGYRGKAWTTRAFMLAASLANKGEGAPVLFIDADVRFGYAASAPSLIHSLLDPVLFDPAKNKKPAFMVTLNAPTRSYYSDDGIVHWISNLFLEVFYGLPIHQPTGGEFSLSKEAIKTAFSLERVKGLESLFLAHDDVYELEQSLLARFWVLKMAGFLSSKDFLVVEEAKRTKDHNPVLLVGVGETMGVIDRLEKHYLPQTFFDIERHFSLMKPLLDESSDFSSFLKIQDAQERLSSDKDKANLKLSSILDDDTRNDLLAEYIRRVRESVPVYDKLKTEGMLESFMHDFITTSASLTVKQPDKFEFSPEHFAQLTTLFLSRYGQESQPEERKKLIQAYTPFVLAIILDFANKHASSKKEDVYIKDLGSAQKNPYVAALKKAIEESGYGQEKGGARLAQNKIWSVEDRKKAAGILIDALQIVNNSSDHPFKNRLIHHPFSAQEGSHTIEYGSIVFDRKNISYIKIKGEPVFDSSLSFVIKLDSKNAKVYLESAADSKKQIYAVDDRAYVWEVQENGEEKLLWSGARFAEKSSLPYFLSRVENVFGTQRVAGESLALLQRRGNYIFKFEMEGARLIAKAEGVTVKVPLSRASKTWRRSGQIAESAEISISDIRLIVETLENKIAVDLQSLEDGKIVNIVYDLDLLPDSAFEFYARHLLANMERFKRKHPQVFFDVEGQKRDQVLRWAKEMDVSLGLYSSSDSGAVETIHILDADKGVKPEGPIELPSRRLEAGDIPAYQALFELGSKSRAFKPGEVSEKYLNAYSTLAGSRLSNLAVSQVLSGVADEKIIRQASLIQAVMRANFDKAIQFLKNALRMIGKSA
jgi:UDPglucose 6-dehydrogenase